jgi:hypothetical protein
MNKQKLIELRCKAWGITEDEYYCNQCSDFSLEDMARAYRRGKNKGARDKAIQNVGFYQKQMQDIYDKKNKQIAELEKENAALKEKLKPENCLKSLAKKGYVKFTSEQLTEAKEIIREFMKYEINEYDGSLEIHFEELKKQAEQFLKESEVEK